MDPLTEALVLEVEANLQRKTVETLLSSCEQLGDMFENGNSIFHSTARVSEQTKAQLETQIEQMRRIDRSEAHLRSLESRSSSETGKIGSNELGNRGLSKTMSQVTLVLSRDEVKNHKPTRRHRNTASSPRSGGSLAGQCGPSD
jgi:hypothetical protein